MKHIATVIPLSVNLYACVKCGAETHANCNCGQPYLPKAGRARQAVDANPQKSNRALAAELGVDEKTVRNARTADNSAVERTGLDGKTRRLPIRAEEDERSIEADIEPENYYEAYMIRADQARHFASYSGKPTQEVVAMARQVAAAWTKLAKQLEESL